ncbi:MAG: hypothetical protein HZA88_23965 [Verrucomicrobia bacterium]|nr:hypothetical protein [Verrucomicrobiota bacterium]
MRWGDLDSTTQSALALSAALIVLGALAAWFSFQLQERWPLLVFLIAFFGVAIFLGGFSAWQRYNEPKETNLESFKQRAMFGLQSRQLRGVRSGWTTARDLCLLALIAALAAFMLHSLFIGGDAFRGYSEHGRYFVRLHTAVTEVTPDQWRLNWLFGAAVFTLLPLSLIVTTIAVYRERHDRFRYDDMDV